MRPRHMGWLALAALSMLAACQQGDDGEADAHVDAKVDAHVEGGGPGAPSWSLVAERPEAALLGVHGDASGEVWAVGADDGSGPQVLRWDGDDFERLDTGSRGDLWWVHVAQDGAVYLGGSDATVLRHTPDGFERLTTPGSDGQTVYGLWSPRPGELYAAGSGDGGRDGFLWYLDEGGMRALPLPTDDGPVPGLFKVWGTDADDVWAVGGAGLVLHGNAVDGFERVPSPTTATLFTVHARADRVVMVGGDAGGVLLEVDGDTLVDRSPELAPLLQGVTVAPDGSAWAVGLAGSIYRSTAPGEPYEPVDPGLDVPASSVLHAVWADAAGQVWSAGGNVLSERLDGGMVLRYGSTP